MLLNLALGFHGAAMSTTGSRHILSVDDKNILLDCGLYQGKRKEAIERNLRFSFNPRAIHSVLLSHAHIDHSGALPSLVKQAFNGPIYCTPATRDLCSVMLRDSGHIQEKDAEWLRKRNLKRNRREDVEPLYTVDDAIKAMEHFRSVAYHQPQNVLKEVTATWIDAGHILGSAAVLIDIMRQGRKYRLAFSGDIGRVGLPLLRDPEIPTDVDWLMMEGTYGARKHDPISQAKEELRETIVRIAARGGKIIVPSFSVERTQEIVYYLNQLYRENNLPQIPVYVDSPLAIDVTDIFRLHAENFDEETKRDIEANKDIFGFARLTYVKDVEQSKKLNQIPTPCIIISASGMCEAGRIRHHLANSIEDSKNCIMFVGYQAEGTLGRAIVERHEEVNIFGEPYRLRAEVVTLNTMSGHADQDDLVRYAAQVKAASPKLKKVYLVHGETDALQTLAARLKAELSLSIIIPELGERHIVQG